MVGRDRGGVVCAVCCGVVVGMVVVVCRGVRVSVSVSMVCTVSGVPCSCCVGRVRVVGHGGVGLPVVGCVVGAEHIRGVGVPVPVV